MLCSITWFSCIKLYVLLYINIHPRYLVKIHLEIFYTFNERKTNFN